MHAIILNEILAQMSHYWSDPNLGDELAQKLYKLLKRNKLQMHTTSKLKVTTPKSKIMVVCNIASLLKTLDKKYGLFEMKNLSG
jgi:hypothetical protein